MYFSEMYTIFFLDSFFHFYTSSKCGRSLCPTLYVGYLSMFPTRNGTGVLFMPAYIDHGQYRQANRCYVVCYLLYVFLETVSTRIS